MICSLLIQVQEEYFGNKKSSYEKSVHHHNNQNKEKSPQEKQFFIWNGRHFLDGIYKQPFEVQQQFLKHFSDLAKDDNLSVLDYEKFRNSKHKIQAA